MLPYMCPHTTIYVSSCYYTCVLILLYMCPHATIYVSSYYNMCPHATTHVSSYSYICVVMLLYLCPHTLADVCAEADFFCFWMIFFPGRTQIPLYVWLLYVSSYCYMCPHPSTCVLILLYVSSYYYIFHVRMLGRMCAKRLIFVSRWEQS